MEPVPETERMEEFKSSPVPSLRLGNPNAAIPRLDLDATRKPPTVRRSTDPCPSSPSASSWGPATMASLPYRPRTASPLSGSHGRSRSVASLAVPMSRTQSMPGVSGSGRILYSPQLRPASPSGSPSRVRTPRKPVDEAFPPTSPVRTSVLDTDRKSTPGERSTSPILGSSINTMNRLRRPASPLRSFAPSSTSSLSLLPSTPSSNSSASSFRAYDAFAPYGGGFSSVPSTPTSARSRSPSISSLETIPDSPDAEEAALEAERMAQLKAAADAAEGSDSSDSSSSKGRTGNSSNNSDVPVRGRTMSYGSRDKRKRWSVCGAERRGDIDLETIWED
ncbi:basic proline-rich protein [Purpureocillium lavendulum]|uniref:Basic proline-rich protein n=1 Tax=Purpureocillium lavendulum TaxID=1247861 RepID=A0AB34G5Q3_9HYPO|nr:basic proline-rich protein [Purpureocillium lavendulum]